MKKEHIWFIVGGIVLLIMFGGLSSTTKQVKKTGPGGSSIARTITPAVVEPNGIFTVRITATKGTDDMAGIIKELKPSSFTFYDSANWISTFDSKVEDSYGDNLDIAFTEAAASGYYEYQIQAGSSSASLSGVVDWEGGTTEGIGGETALLICLDSDNDGYGSDTDRQGCTYSTIDCDDAVSSTYPGATETCNNVDDDCDTSIDESLSQSCSVANSWGTCSGTETCSAGAWIGCTAATPEDEASMGACDGIDNDCDGSVDETQNTGGDANCDTNVCDSELLTYMSEWKAEHRTVNCDSTPGCVSDQKLLASMSSWKSTHRLC